MYYGLLSYCLRGCRTNTRGRRPDGGHFVTRGRTSLAKSNLNAGGRNCESAINTLNSVSALSQGPRRLVVGVHWAGRAIISNWNRSHQKWSIFVRKGFENRRFSPARRAQLIGSLKKGDLRPNSFGQPTDMDKIQAKICSGGPPDSPPRLFPGVFSSHPGSFQDCLYFKLKL